MHIFPHALKPGAKLRSDEAYEILSILGQGGFGITYLATSDLYPQCAIKEFFPQQYCQRHGSKILPTPGLSEEFDFEDYRNKFLDEARQLDQFDHPNIVKIQDYFEDQNTAYFVMRFEEGSTLHQIVSEKLYLSEQEAIRIIKEVAHALQPVHEAGVLHRDIKPTNVIVRVDGSSVLIDFGAAREITDGSMVHTAILSHGFAPPEQYDENGAKDKTVDIYALGATLYYCVTGTKPSRADSRKETRLVPPIEINPKISEKTNDLILKAMELNPDDRFQNVSEFLYELTAISPNTEEDQSLSNSQNEAIEIVEHFISDEESDVLVLSGCVGTGKTRLINKISDTAQRLNHSVKPMTVGSRIAEFINQNHGLEVGSLYRQLFDFDHEKDEEVNDPAKVDLAASEVRKDDLRQSKFGLRKNEDSAQTIYLIDEAQLLSDDSSENDLFIFGSGRLLHDLIAYSEVKEHSNRKLIFIGDAKQLTWGNKDESAMSLRYLESVYQLKCRFYEVDDIVCEGAQRSIVNEAAKVRNSLIADRYNRLDVNPDDRNIFKIEKTAFRELYLNTESINSTMVLTYSNDQALEINKYVRKILGKTGTIAVGDWIMFHNTIGIADEYSDMVSYVHKGETAEVIAVEPTAESFQQPLKGRPVIPLTYRKIKINLPRLGRQYEVRILENYLYSERELSKDEQIAILVRAKKEFKAKHCKESASQVEFNSFLRSDPFFNAGLVKFAYSMTCHRALGIKWQNVFVNCQTNKGKENDEYFRWLYSALTRATKKAFILNDVVISPVSKIEWKDSPDAFDELYKPSGEIFQQSLNFELPPEAIAQGMQHNFPGGDSHLRNFWFLCEQKLDGNGITIEKIDHKSFHEVYTFKDKDGNRAGIKFNYNGQNKFTKHQFQPKSPLAERVMELLNSEVGEAAVSFDDFDKPFLQELYQHLTEKISSRGIRITQLEHSQYHEKYTFRREAQEARLHFYYDDRGFITSVVPVKFNSEELMEELREIVLNRIRFAHA